MYIEDAFHCINELDNLNGKGAELKTMLYLWNQWNMMKTVKYLNRFYDNQTSLISLVLS